MAARFIPVTAAQAAERPSSTQTGLRTAAQAVSGVTGLARLANTADPSLGIGTGLGDVNAGLGILNQATSTAPDASKALGSLSSLVSPGSTIGRAAVGAAQNVLGPGVLSDALPFVGPALGLGALLASDNPNKGQAAANLASGVGQAVATNAAMNAPTTVGLTALDAGFDALGPSAVTAPVEILSLLQGLGVFGSNDESTGDIRARQARLDRENVDQGWLNTGERVGHRLDAAQTLPDLSTMTGIPMDRITDPAALQTFMDTTLAGQGAQANQGFRNVAGQDIYRLVAPTSPDFARDFITWEDPMAPQGGQGMSDQAVQDYVFQHGGLQLGGGRAAEAPPPTSYQDAEGNTFFIPGLGDDPLADLRRQAAAG